MPAHRRTRAQPTRGDTLLDRYLALETRRLSQRFLDGAKSWRNGNSAARSCMQEYLDMLGLWPLPEKTPLKATVTGTLERDGVVIEKLHFQSKPGLYVTGNLYRPEESDRSDEKLPAMLYVCGHSGTRPRRQQDRLPGPRHVVRQPTATSA